MKKIGTDRVITFHPLPKGRFLYFWASRLGVPGGTGPVRQWWARPENGSQGLVFECVLWCCWDAWFMCLYFLWDCYGLLVEDSRWLTVGIKWWYWQQKNQGHEFYLSLLKAFDKQPYDLIIWNPPLIYCTVERQHVLQPVSLAVCQCVLVNPVNLWISSYHPPHASHAPIFTGATVVAFF